MCVHPRKRRTSFRCKLLPADDTREATPNCREITQHYPRHALPLSQLTFLRPRIGRAFIADYPRKNLIRRSSVRDDRQSASACSSQSVPSSGQSTTTAPFAHFPYPRSIRIRKQSALAPRPRPMRVRAQSATRPGTLRAEAGSIVGRRRSRQSLARPVTLLRSKLTRPPPPGIGL